MKHDTNSDVKEKASLPTTTTGKLSVGAMADQFSEVAGSGLENVQVGKDTLIPRLTILQALSPAVTRNKPEYNPEAKPGDFYDTGFQELMPSPLLYIPVYFMTQYLEWAPGRKGLRGVHNSPDILAKAKPNEKGQPVLPNGNTLSETAQFFGLNVVADYRLSFIGMTSTQLKKARRWNTLATSEKALRKDGTEFTPPLFYRAYELSTVPETNDQGSWDGWKIERAMKIEDMEGAAQKVFELAKSLYESIKAGRSRADLSTFAGEEDNVVDGKVNNKPM